MNNFNEDPAERTPSDIGGEAENWLLTRIAEAARENNAQAAQLGATAYLTFQQAWFTGTKDEEDPLTSD